MERGRRYTKHNLNEAQRYRTRDIQFAPANPMPGEVETIQARIQNFSLIPTDSAVTVQFYLEDPDDGEVLLEDISGMTSITTDLSIKARGHQTISFDWLVPESIEPFSRIYAVLDPNSRLDEIHETNNKGWSVLSVAGQATDNEHDNVLTYNLELKQNYPSSHIATHLMGIPPQFVKLKYFESRHSAFGNYPLPVLFF